MPRLLQEIHLPAGKSDGQVWLFGDGVLERVLSLFVAAEIGEGDGFVGKRPVLVIGYRGRALAPRDGRFEVFLQDECERAIGEERPTLRIVGAQRNRLLETLDRFVLASQIGQRVGKTAMGRCH